MTRLPVVDAREMESALFALGFERVRQQGSHALYRHADDRTTTVPHHKGHDLARPLIRCILRDIDMAPDEFAAMLGRRV